MAGGLVPAIIKTPLRHHLHVGDPWWVMLGKWRGARKLSPARPAVPEPVVEAPPAE